MINMSKQCHECFRVLADETRLRILRAIRTRPVNVGDITAAMHVTQPTVSYHLKMLDELGLITREKRGREVLYAFNKNYPCKGCGVLSVSIKL
ncbi:MAG: transcriptional regulator, ArsR family protein [Parcubacteria group bacterium GW2011_GWA2_47_10b]|nr:MAG: transcriptional regulator, ArsR family protein [Parcubacteria group bacterium GW2011_GWA2_47_10b]KKU85445.1 MAG: transcriptional regulator, ArsR family protein [Parcubacteria group bacterium GW2011_GWA1_47_9]